MKTTELLRDQLGLSQEMMGVYLGLNRSQIAMYETSKRDLPTAVLIKLANITLFFEQNQITDAIEKEFLIKQELEVKAFFEHQLKELEYKKIKAERLLEKTQKKYRQNLALYHLALHLQENNVELAELLLQQATTGMKQNGLLNQTKQKMKLETITSQLDYCQSLKEK
jgi:transcriptional regulator with XRE-family HTH domain